MNSALLYVRVSSKEQEKEGYSLDAQEKLGKDYALRKGLNIARLWKVSESAWRLERKAFNQMIDYARNHKDIGHIIFDITDRMTRNDFDKMKIYDLIKLHDKTIHFSRSNKTLNKASGSDDEFMLDIDVAVAKKLSNDISRKVKMGMTEKAEQGYYPSFAPLGYMNEPLTKHLIIDEERSPFVRKAYELMASGNCSIKMAASLLSKEGLRSRRGQKVGKSVLHHVLRNPIYYGAFSWDGKFYEGKHEPIISKAIYDQVQVILGGKTHFSTQRRDFAFNNLMTCGICDCKVLAERRKDKYTYYHCTFSKERHAGVQYYREEKIADMLFIPLSKITIGKDKIEWLKRALDEKQAQSRGYREKQHKMLKAELERAITRLSRLVDARIDGQIDQETFKAKESEYTGLKIDIVSKLNTFNGPDFDIQDRANKTFELCNRLPVLYKKANMAEKAQIARLIASNYRLINATLCPTYRKPFGFIAKGLDSPTWYA